VFSVRIAVDPADFDRTIAQLWDAGTLGIQEGDGSIEAFFDTREQAQLFGTPIQQPDTDWVQATEDAWPPLEVGRKFFVAAPWRTEPTPPGRFRLEINPGTQCGTGQHPCTRLCLEAMERVIKPGDRVLDVGSGSGILSVAAKLLGASVVVACDIDADAATAAPLQEFAIPFYQGSVDAARTGAFDVVVANISDIVLDELHADFKRVARRRILSGFQDEKGEWACIVE
jgi:ribosomal protein L11 methyltransferase